MQFTKNNMYSWFVKRCIKIDKNVRFFVSTFVLGSVMLVSTMFFFDKAPFFIVLLFVLSYFLTLFSLLEQIEKIEWFMLFLVPVLFTVSFYLFFFLFPVRWLTRIPFIIFYSVSIYAILRSSNIFNVGVEKNLQLYRAAFSVNYLFHTITLFFLSNFVYSLKLNFVLNGIVIGMTVIILAVQLFWSIKLNLYLNTDTVLHGLFIGLLIGEGTTLLSFLPFTTSVIALLVTASYYSLVGINYAHLDQRLFKETVREYIFVLIFVCVIAFLSLMSW